MFVPSIARPSGLVEASVDVRTPEHCPPWQLEPVRHVFPQEPQFAVSVCVLTHVLPHSVEPALHEQPPQEQALEHVAVPFPSHASVDCGAQTPCPVQAEKPDQVPLLHVCVSVPQFPHGFDVTSQLEPHAT